MADDQGILGSIKSLERVYTQAREAATSAIPLSDTTRELIEKIEGELPVGVRTELKLVMPTGNGWSATFSIGFDNYSFHRCMADDWYIQVGMTEGKHYPFGSLRSGIVEYVAMHKAGLLESSSARYDRMFGFGS